MAVQDLPTVNEMVRQVRTLKPREGVAGVAKYCGIDSRTSIYSLRDDEKANRLDTSKPTYARLVDGWRRAKAEEAGYGTEPPALKLEQVMGAIGAMSQPAKERVAEQIHDLVMRALQEDVNSRFAFPAEREQPTLPDTDTPADPAPGRLTPAEPPPTTNRSKGGSSG